MEEAATEIAAHVKASLTAAQRRADRYSSSQGGLEMQSLSPRDSFNTFDRDNPIFTGDSSMAAAGVGAAGVGAVVCNNGTANEAGDYRWRDCLQALSK